MTELPMTTVNVDDLVARLQERLASLGDGRDCRSDNEKAAYRRDYDATQRIISGLRNAPDDLVRAEAVLADLEAQRAAVLEKQASLEKEISEAPDWRSFADGRARDAEYDRQQLLARQLALLRDGRLFYAPGVTYEALTSLDARLVERTERRDRAQRALDGHLAAAEQLLAAASQLLAAASVTS